MTKEEFKRIREDIFDCTQIEMATILGVSASTIQRYERGEDISDRIERKLKALIDQSKNSGNTIQQGDKSNMENVKQNVGGAIIKSETDSEKIEYLEKLIIEKDKQIALLEKLLEMKK